MDAQERVEVVPAEAPGSSLAAERSPECCPAAGCRAGCALEVVDRLLRVSGKVRGEDVDSLLDFRRLLHQHTDAEAALCLFCRLRLSLEDRYYLEMYRIRHWLENHVEAAIQFHPADVLQVVPLKLDRYCLEAIRHAALQGAPRPANARARSVRFQFRQSALHDQPEQCSLSAAR